MIDKYELKEILHEVLQGEPNKINRITCAVEEYVDYITTYREQKSLADVIEAIRICGYDDPGKCPYFATEDYKCCSSNRYCLKEIPPIRDAYVYLKFLQEEIKNDKD